MQGKHVVEFGCGTGRMAPELIKRGVGSYLGYDFTTSGLRIARQRAEEAGLANEIRFELADIGTLKHIEADCVFSMGLFSWIPLSLIDHIFSITRDVDYLHNFSERKISVRQILKDLLANSFYRNLNEHKPQSWKLKEIADVARQKGWSQLYCLKHPSLFNSACVSSLPFKDTLGTCMKLPV